MHDDDGRVLIPGFYDDVLELTDEERELFGRVPHDDAQFLSVSQSRALYGERGYTTLERLGARPTAEVNGIGGGYQGSGGKTIIPSDAFVKLSFRLVANQDPARHHQGGRAVRRRPGFRTASTRGHRMGGRGRRPCLVPLGTPGVRRR